MLDSARPGPWNALEAGRQPWGLELVVISPRLRSTVRIHLSLTIFPVCWVISGLPDFRGRSRLRVLVVVRTVAPSALSGQQELLPKGSVSWLK